MENNIKKADILKLLKSHTYGDTLETEDGSISESYMHNEDAANELSNRFNGFLNPIRQFIIDDWNKNGFTEEKSYGIDYDNHRTIVDDLEIQWDGSKWYFKD